MDEWESLTERYLEAARHVEPLCLSCEASHDRVRLTPAPRIHRTEFWDVEHACPSALEGWLVVALRRHALAVHDLSPAELHDLADVLQKGARALKQELDCEWEYVMQLREAPGFHVHFHLIARPTDLPPRLRGGLVVRALIPEEEEPLPEAVIVDAAKRLSRRFTSVEQ